MLEDKLDQDIKSALLAGDKFRVTTLRQLKATLLNAKVAQNKRDVGLEDSELQAIFSKEAKQRQESADLYLKGGDKNRADAELEEKAIIETYLPKPLSEDEITLPIDEVIKNKGSDISQMGQIIGAVKQKLGASADGSVIARLTKERLS
jgi:hypothetical protein